jgi:hypothetical protein
MEVVKVPVCIELEPDNPELHVPATELHPFHEKLMLSHNSRIGYRSLQMLSRYK